VAKKILVRHVYAEEQDSKTQKDFKEKQKDKTPQKLIHDLLGTNEQKFNRRDRNYEN
jgi:hypothetical protein